MSFFKNHQVVTAFSLINLLFCAELFAANIYVDKTLSSSCTSGNYSTTNRACNGSDGKAYSTIQRAVDNMNTSDDIYIRGGTYFENVLVSGSTTPNGTANDYASMQSYPGEWAIIDGQNNAQYTIGKLRNGRDGGNDLAYWKFERLELTGGTNGGSDGGAGLYVSGGPFIVRYCYIHDNVAATEDNNPGGIVGYTWTDSIIEYNWIENNGMATGTGGNAANITIFSDYMNTVTGKDGFTNSKPSTRRNEIRYNYISGSSYGTKHKGSQLFTGRNVGVADYDDTYDGWGDKIHHNYFTGQRRASVNSYQDFVQVYNNIFDGVAEAIYISQEPNYQIYKAVTFNNTMIDVTYKSIVRYGCDWFDFNQNPALYGWDYNNLIEGSDKLYGFWFEGAGINVLAGCSTNRYPYLVNSDISNYIGSNNYFYDPITPDIFRYGNTFYTASEYEAQIETGNPKVAYTNPYDAGNLLFAGTTGANKYITLGSHVIEGSTTIANGGVGGSHPYLSGVTIPSYVGAVDPNNSSWVANLLCMTDIEVLKKGGVDGPACSKRPKAITTINAIVTPN